MPNIVDYSIVLDRLTKQGLRSLYFNSGAFGFPANLATVSRGWMGPPDSSIRASVRPLVRQAGPPFDATLSHALLSIWRSKLSGPVWAMPKSHWAYELEFGNRGWLRVLLNTIGVDAKQLAPLNNAAAIEFLPADELLFGIFTRDLLSHLVASDFQLVFPGFSTICTIHTRCQLWWTTTDLALVEHLDQLFPGDARTNT
jgi:hypothetical protein